MARIFRKKNKVVLEGKGRYDTDDVTYFQQNESISVVSESENKVVFNARWNKIRNAQGNLFTTVEALTTYLESVFYEAESVEVKVDELQNNLGDLDYNFETNINTQLTF